MKAYTSRFLRTIALGYMAFPVVYLFLAAIVFDIPGRACLRILLSPSYYALCFVCALAGYGLWEMKRWSWYLFIFSNLLIVYANAIVVSNEGESSHKLFAFVFSVGLLAALTFRVGREVRVPYFLPRIRWWESNPRYKLNVLTRVRIEGSPVDLEGEVLDLSMGGCFIKLRSDLVQDQKLTLRFELFGLPMEIDGIVVWRTPSTVTHPKGVGVKFTVIPRVERRNLRAATQRLKKIAAFYRSSRYLMSQEEFSKRYDELQRTRIQVAREAKEKADHDSGA